MKKIQIITAAVLCALLMCLAFAGCTPSVDPIDDNYRVFYQIFVGSFSDSDGDGIGDLRGIINRMDYLNDGNKNSATSLGVQGIWLSPIFVSPSYHKYDTTNYYEIDPKFGTMDDLKELIDLCHKRNVKLILDLVINHTSTGNEWFQKFRSAQRLGKTDDPYFDYYSYATYETMISGNNYHSLPGAAGVFYEGNFDSGMPELNYDNQEVRQAVLDVAKYYLDMGIDGFRFDAVKYIYYESNPKTTEFWDWYMGELRKIKPDIYCVGECWSGDGEILSYYQSLNCFNFTSAQTEGVIASAARSGQIDVFARYVESFQKQAKAKNPDSMYIPFIANHDTDRAAGYLPIEAIAEGKNGEYVTSHPAYVAANLYILCSGSPFIYYGEEIGMKGTRGAATTDANRRLAMLWGDDDTVKNPTGSTYKAELQINGTVASQQADENSLLRHYNKLIKIRNKYPQIARGDYTAVIATNGCAGFSIEYKGEKTLLLHNVATEEVTVDLAILGVDVKTLCDCIGLGNAKLNGTQLTIGGETTVILM